MNLPTWATELRPFQHLAIDDILTSIESKDVVFYEAPTGAGKTLIGEMVRQSLGNVRGVYLCSSLTLQDQFLRDFPKAALLKGRSNYPTLNHPDRYNKHNPSYSLSTADCTKRKSSNEWICDWCDPVPDCPYEIAKTSALAAELVCTNSYYYLYECNYIGTLRGRDLVIVDEVDTLESIMMSFVQVAITKPRMIEFKIPYPGKKTVMSSWVEWAKECDGRLKSIPTHEEQTLFDTVNLKTIRFRKRLENFKKDIKRLLDPINGLEQGNWIYDGYREDDVIFKPITVAPYAKEYLWRHGKKWLMMSATIISPMELAISLGLA